MIMQFEDWKKSSSFLEDLAEIRRTDGNICEYCAFQRYINDTQAEHHATCPCLCHITAEKGFMLKPSNKFITSSRATPNISFFILIVDMIMKGSGYVKRVFEAVDEVSYQRLKPRKHTKIRTPDINYLYFFIVTSFIRGRLSIYSKKNNREISGISRN